MRSSHLLVHQNPYRSVSLKMNKQRKTQSFQSNEVDKLLELIALNKNIIFSKSNFREKNRIWVEMAKEISSLNHLTPDRSRIQIYKKWHDLKRDARLYRQNTSRTGGGPRETPPIYFDAIIDILGKESPYWEGIQTTNPDDIMPDSAWTIQELSTSSIACEPQDEKIDIAFSVTCEDQASGSSNSSSLTQVDGSGGMTILTLDVPEKILEQAMIAKRKARKEEDDDETALTKTYLKTQIEVNLLSKQYLKEKLRRLGVDPCV